MGLFLTDPIRLTSLKLCVPNSPPPHTTCSPVKHSENKGMKGSTKQTQRRHNVAATSRRCSDVVMSLCVWWVHYKSDFNNFAVFNKLFQVYLEAVHVCSNPQSADIKK